MNQYDVFSNDIMGRTAAGSQRNKLRMGGQTSKQASKQVSRRARVREGECLSRQQGGHAVCNEERVWTGGGGE